MSYILIGLFVLAVWSALGAVIFFERIAQAFNLGRQPSVMWYHWVLMAPALGIFLLISWIKEWRKK